MDLSFTSPEGWEVPPSAGIQVAKLEGEQLSPWAMTEDKSWEAS